MPPNPPEPSSPGDIDSSPPRPLAYQHPSVLAAGDAPWSQFARSNWWIPFLFAVLVATSYFVTGRQQRYPELEVLLRHAAVMVALTGGLQLIVGASGQLSLGHAAFYALPWMVMPYPESAGLFPEQIREPIAAAPVVLLICGLLLISLWLGVRLSRVSRVAGGLLSILPPLLVAECMLDTTGLLSGFVGSIEGHFLSFDGRIAAVTHMKDWPDGARVVADCAAEMVSFAVISATAAVYCGVASARRHPMLLPVVTAAVALVVGQHSFIPLRPIDPAWSWLIPYFEFHALHLLLALTAVLICWRVSRSLLGSVMTAVQDDENAAAIVGISATAQRLRALVIGSALAGAAGSLGSPWPIGTPSGGLLESAELLAIVIVGGRKSITGVLITTLLLVSAWAFAPAELLRWRFAFYAIALILFIRYRPQGLFGDWELFRSRSALPKVKPGGAS